MDADEMAEAIKSHTTDIGKLKGEAIRRDEQRIALLQHIDAGTAMMTVKIDTVTTAITDMKTVQDERHALGQSRGRWALRIAGGVVLVALVNWILNGGLAGAV